MLVIYIFLENILYVYKNLQFWTIFLSYKKCATEKKYRIQVSKFLFSNGFVVNTL